MKDSISTKIIGRVTIRDKQTGEILRQKCNAVHPKNMAYVIARALAHDTTSSWVHTMALGNGGTHISSSGAITYLTPNTVGSSATLYNKTYSEQIDPISTTTPATNGVVASQLATPKTSSIIECTMELDTTEPNGQLSTDTTNADTDSTFSFDELGLFSKDGLLLTHVIFEPITKSANRGIIITYTVEIKVS